MQYTVQQGWWLSPSDTTTFEDLLMSKLMQYHGCGPLGDAGFLCLCCGYFAEDRKPCVSCGHRLYHEAARAQIPFQKYLTQREAIVAAALGRAYTTQRILSETGLLTEWKLWPLPHRCLTGEGQDVADLIEEKYREWREIANQINHGKHAP